MTSGTGDQLFDVTVAENQRVAMRDGTLLAADVYRPVTGNARCNSQSGHGLPVLLERTPYNKSGISRGEVMSGSKAEVTRADVARYFAQRGYAFVMQDCRGRYQSEGVFRKYLDEANDGVDTLEWILQQPWCDGRVGTMGLSYGAHTQCALASLSPPGLACMFMDSGGFSSAFESGIRQGGAFEMKQATWAFKHALLSPLTARDSKRRQALESTDISDWFRRLSWTPGQSPLSAAPEYESYFFEQWRKGRFDSYWTQPGLFAEGYYDQFPEVPVAIVGSWYDPYVQACVNNFNGLRGDRRPDVHLLMGPWTHGDRSQSHAGDVSFGETATLDDNLALDYCEFRLRWFDEHLRPGRRSAPVFSAPVRYFCMGGGSGGADAEGRLIHAGRWRTASAWPPENTQTLHYYLNGSGALSSEAPQAANSRLDYAFDPQDPVPTIGGAVTSGAPVMFGGAYDQVQLPETFAVKPVAKRKPLGERQDVLVFQTPPLERDLLVSGPVVAELWVSSDQPDTDFTIKLLEVYPPSDDFPDGFAMNICDGIFRMRYREGWDKEVSMTPDEVYPIQVTAFDTSNLFVKGNRLRLDISSSNYPHFDVNPNTGSACGDMLNMSVAHNRIHCSARYPSSVRLCIESGTG